MEKITHVNQQINLYSYNKYIYEDRSPISLMYDDHSRKDGNGGNSAGLSAGEI